MATQRAFRNAEHEHVVRAFELHFVRARVVAKGEVAGVQQRFASVLPVHAAAVELQVQEEHGRASAGHMSAGMAHPLRFGIGFGNAEFAEAAARERAAETAQVYRVRH